jgi:putative N-acetylmannosamine-6-phosphate epimerase
MSPTAVPTRITIDFRDALLPSRTWILGVDEAAPARVELIAFDGSDRLEPSLPHRRDAAEGLLGPYVRPTALMADCACPDFCERDHANE